MGVPSRTTHTVIQQTCARTAGHRQLGLTSSLIFHWSTCTRYCSVLLLHHVMREKDAHTLGKYDKPEAQVWPLVVTGTCGASPFGELPPVANEDLSEPWLCRACPVELARAGGRCLFP